MNKKSGALIPEGLWVMNPARSRRLIPGTHTLWIVRNDGEEMAFASVETDLSGTVKLTSWHGRYDGPAMEVVGSGMMARLTAPADGEMLITGEIPGMGAFSEHCVLQDDARRLRCTGHIQTGEGVVEYVDDFDWHSPTPGMPASA